MLSFICTMSLDDFKEMKQAKTLEVKNMLLVRRGKRSRKREMHSQRFQESGNLSS